MTEPTAITIRCADCDHPAASGNARCIPCHLAHTIVTYAADRQIPTTVVRGPIIRARVSATGADGRPAWLDTLTDVRYLAADLDYAAPPPPPARLPGPAPLNRWARQHDRCIDCNRTDRPHMGFGRCTRCYVKARRRAVPAGPPVTIAA